MRLRFPGCDRLYCKAQWAPGSHSRMPCNFSVSQPAGANRALRTERWCPLVPAGAAGTGVAGSPGLAGRMCYQHSMRCFMSALLLTLGLVSACSAPAQSGPPLTGAASPVTNPTPGTSPAPAATDPTAFGAECSEAKACAAGLSCTTYYGIAGPSGPAFHSCEVPCGQDKAQCPDATTCVTIADGPGMVCRPKER